MSVVKSQSQGRATGTIRSVGVVGGGQMGTGIAEVCARNGLDVIVIEAGPAEVAHAEARITSSLQRAVSRGKLERDVLHELIKGIRFSDDLSALSETDFVVEAVVEQASVKHVVLQELDRVLPTRAIIASNTSSVPIIDLGMATERPDRVIGMHFFNPVPVLPLVEVVSSLKTSAETTRAVVDLATRVLGKEVVTSQDRAGFVVNTLLVPYLLAAIRMLESGFAEAVEIDKAMRLGCAHPMGPLELADLIGLDTVKSIADSLYEEFKEPSYVPPALLLRKVRAQQLGRKTGHGFFDYPNSAA